MAADAPRRRLLPIALGISLVFNLFLVGFIAGHRSQAVRIDAASSGSAVFVARVRSLPLADRVRFGLAMRRHRAEIREAGDRLRASGREALAAIAAPAYDRQRADRAFAELRARRAAFQQATHGAVLDALDEISPESRARLGAPHP